MKELRVELFGRVQGVGLRHFVKENADKFNLKGYVMNNDDGSVSVVAQGEKDKLEIFLSAVQKGPSLAKVEGASYFWKKADFEYKGFVISLDKGMIQDQKRNFFNLGKRVLGFRDSVPKHIAVIPDGNRRWSKKNGFKTFEGHRRSSSFDNLISLLEEARKSGVEYLTFWAFSTENWKRSKTEIDYLFKLIDKFSEKFKKYAIKNKIRFRHLGRKDRLPKKIVGELEKMEKATKDFDEMNVQICLDYGGRDEIVRAVNKILKSGVSEVKENDLANFLDSAEIPDPDLVIRTSGEKRTSGFMPFQSAYSELYFADVYFPDFGPKELRKAIEDFGKRGRRFGS